MAERKRLGLIFSVNRSWMGGTYYVLNLIYALNTLADSEKPEIVLLCKTEDDFKFATDYTEYPYLSYRLSQKKLNIPSRIINRIARRLFNHNVIPIFGNVKGIDYIFPVIHPSQIINGVKNIAWIPDFQHLHLPHLFPEKEIAHRDSVNCYFRDHEIPIVFSSMDARQDFCNTYTNSQIKQNLFLYRFASKPPVQSFVADVFEKYGVSPNGYYLCSNQFWVHKNHSVLFEAIKILSEQGIEIKLLCTGNNVDFRNRSYYNDLENYIKTHHLENYIKLLGLIDRKEQLTLMANCRALIQPSLFEGWNTSVEEAKSLNKFLILSDLDVHKEQCKENAIFFKRHDADDLANKIKCVEETQINVKVIDYNENVKKAAGDFVSILSSL